MRVGGPEQLNIYIDEFKNEYKLGTNQPKIFIYTSQMNIYPWRDVDKKRERISNAYSNHAHSPEAAGLRALSKSFYYRASTSNDDSNWASLSMAVERDMAHLYDGIAGSGSLDVYGVFACNKIGHFIKRRLGADIAMGRQATQNRKRMFQNFHMLKGSFFGCNLNYWVKELVGEEAKYSSFDVVGGIDGRIEHAMRTDPFLSAARGNKARNLRKREIRERVCSDVEAENALESVTRLSGDFARKIGWDAGNPDVRGTCGWAAQLRLLENAL